MRARSARPVPAELSGDERFRRRVLRLAGVSSVALGMILGLAVATLEAPIGVDAALAAGWVLVPVILVASLRRPKLRYALLVPASLVSVGLLAIAIGWLPTEPPVAVGWLLMASGVWLGGGLGLWLWYRVLPVPAVLDDPFSFGRWALIAIHVGLVVAGFALAASALA